MTLLLGSLYYLSEQYTTREKQEYTVFNVQIEGVKKEVIDEKNNSDNIKFKKSIFREIGISLYFISIILVLILAFIHTKTQSTLPLGLGLPLLVFVGLPYILNLLLIFSIFLSRL